VRDALWSLFSIHHLWMSNRTIACAQVDAHNHAMSDRHQIKPYPLRMADELRQKIENASKESGRSLNAEIVQRLEESFDQPARVIQLTFSKDIPSETQEAMARGLVELASSKGVKADYLLTDDEDEGK
jgi:hypothetical protein